jgi:hypothetical protein
VRHPNPSRFPALVLLSIFGGCSSGLGQQANEVVLCPGSALKVAIGDSTFSINATGARTRKVETSGIEQIVRLIPRRERWFGSLGLYTADGGDAHILVNMEEGWQHFSSEDELVDWLQSAKRSLPLEYTSDGLVVAGRYQTRPLNAEAGPEAALTVEVWILLVNGKRPANLTGAHDSQFKSVSLLPMTCSSPKPFFPSSARQIKGRRYSGRAIDFMAERGLAAEDVERLIRDGERTEEGGRITFMSRGGSANLFFVETRADGSVLEIG